MLKDEGEQIYSTTHDKKTDSKTVKVKLCKRGDLLKKVIKSFRLKKDGNPAEKRLKRWRGNRKNITRWRDNKKG